MAEEIPTNPKAGKSDKRTNRYLEIIAAIFLLAGVVWVFTLIFDFSSGIKTNNAQVEANIASINSHVTGNIIGIRFESYSTVKAGDTLVLLDDAEFRIKVAQAEADLAIAKANLRSIEQSVITSVSNQEAALAKQKGNIASLDKATSNYKRFENMFADSAVTRNQFDQAKAQFKTDQAYLEASEKEVLASKSVTEQYKMNSESAMATVSRKEADLAAARLQLSYTVIVAPVSGIVGERTIQLGELVSNNQALVSIIEQNHKWVLANFKETQVKDMKIGQAVKISLDALDDKEYSGKVKDLSPATGAKFSMIEPDNSTGNFVKITQRIPVLIEFDATPEELKDVKPGMNATVVIRKKD
jgi:membrane fusion protein (multidrug efflux system)